MNLCPVASRRLTGLFLTFTLIAASAAGDKAEARLHAAQHSIAPAATPRADLVVVAPHPDDEALLASGLILQAKQAGERVVVIVMTNGDFNCQADGLTREAESVEGLAALGVDEDDVYFLGYPDGYLARMGQIPLLPVQRRIDGKCAPGNHTYGARGHGRREFHRNRFGAHAVYTVEQAVGDLALLLDQLRPARVAVTHPNDTHPDHAATYTFLRRALDRLNHAPEVLRGLVHNGDCWPTGKDANGHCLPGRIAPHENVPPLSGVLSGHAPDVRLAVPSSCLSTAFDENPKLRAIGAHHSQTHDDPTSYLFSFARAEEVFFRAPRTEATERTVLVRARIASKSPTKNNPETRQSFISKRDEYTLEVDRESLEVAVWYKSAKGPLLLHRWPLPQDSLSRANRNLHVVLERVSFGGNTELEVFADNVLIGVSVVVPAPQSATNDLAPGESAALRDESEQRPIAAF